MRRLFASDALGPDEADGIRAALEAGQLLIYPTDTLYAVGGLVLRADAAARVRAAKGREEAKPLPAVAADVEQVRRLCGRLVGPALAAAEAFWPGPLTLVLPAAADVPEAVTSGSATIAVRIPDRALTRALCRLAGPLISTSANRAGGAPPLTSDEAVAAVGARVAWAIDAGPGSPVPSTIVDATGLEPRLLRAGAIPWDRVSRLWPAAE